MGVARSPLFSGLAAVALITIYLAMLLAAERQVTIATLLILGGLGIFVATRWSASDRVASGFADRPIHLGFLALLAALALAGYFHDDHFVLLLMNTVALYAVATLGLNIQFGYAGVVNFAGASFFGIGAYAAAVLVPTSVPHLLILPIGGALAALAGLLLVVPVLRTRGHYAAVVTIAFALLFEAFLEVNDVLGGPQGMQVPGMRILGHSFNDNIDVTNRFQLSFYANYLALSLVLLVLALVLVRRLERSWLGLNLDALRLDETAASCFGLNIARWKSIAFLLGNFLIGISGAVYGMLSGFVAPNNYTFSDSLILVSILLLGGIGSPRGILAATFIVVVIPQKLQAIQEYRFLLYAAMVIAVLLWRPDGLLPRQVRVYFSGMRP